MNRMGIIKRGLAATAISALAVAGIPALAGTANAAVGTVTVSALGAYDVDELAGASDDITVNVKEVGGAPTVGQAVEYRTVLTPQGGGPQVDSGFVANAGVTDAAGNVQLDFHPTLSGSYVVTVRTASSLVSATPFNVVVGESEITWADGASATSPVGGTDTYTATLALTNTASTTLPGRAITVELTGEDDANFGAADAALGARRRGLRHLDHRRRWPVHGLADRSGDAPRARGGRRTHRLCSRAEGRRRCGRR